MRSKAEILQLIEKSGGIITERNPHLCTIRLRIPGGIINPEELITIGKLLRKNEIGPLHLTTRQTIELSHVDRDKLPSVLTAFGRAGISLGAEHDEIVNITACPGTDRCRLANIATQDLIASLDGKIFRKKMPIRVRIAISACPNGCTSERLSEIGITGIRKPIRNETRCTGCGTCAHTCKENAIIMINGRLNLDDEKCMECGMCIDSCPFHLIGGSEPKYVITVGGRRGRHPQLGYELIQVTSEETAVAVVNRVVDWIYRNAYNGKSLTSQLDSMNFDIFKRKILSEFG